MNESSEKTRKQILLEIVSAVIIPVLSAVGFLFWAYSLIESQPPKILVFPLSGIILITLYYFSGTVYSGVLLCFLTMAGFISIVLTSSHFDRFIYFVETLWLWGMFLLLEKYKRSYEREKSFDREQTEDIETGISLLENRIYADKKRCEDLTKRISSYSSLGGMVNSLGSTLDEEEVVKVISEGTSQLIGKGEWKLKKGYQNDVFAHYSKSFGLPILVENLANDNRFYVKNAKFLSLIAMPVEMNGKFWGVLKGVSNSADAFDENDLRYLSVLADIASIALNNTKLYHKIQELAITDSLTGLYVNNYFKERLLHEINRSKSHKTSLSTAILDVDHFKVFNDTYGHACGDAVLRQIALLLRRRLRETDFISRYGGEEFGVLMPQTGIKEAKNLIEEIRKFMQKEKFFLPVESFQPVFAQITVSAGICALDDSINNAEEFLSRADTALYRAKSMGRNRVEECQ